MNLTRRPTILKLMRAINGESQAFIRAKLKKDMRHMSRSGLATNPLHQASLSRGAMQ